MTDRSRFIPLMASPGDASVMADFDRLTKAQAQAPAPDPADVAEGMRIFRTKADCQTCHGWAADGRKMDTQMPDGANLRTIAAQPRGGS